MLSGIGNPDALRAAGIKPQVALRGVGQQSAGPRHGDDLVRAQAAVRHGPSIDAARPHRHGAGQHLSRRPHHRRQRHPGRHGELREGDAGRRRAGRATAARRRAAHRASLSQAVPAALSGRVRRPRRHAASGEPGRGRARLRRSRRADPHPAEFHVHRAGMEDAARRNAADARRHAPTADGAVRRQASSTRCLAPTRRWTRTSATPRSRFITRSAPARWAAKTTRPLWSIRICGCAASTGCA